MEEGIGRGASYRERLLPRARLGRAWWLEFVTRGLGEESVGFRQAF